MLSLVDVWIMTYTSHRQSDLIGAPSHDNGLTKFHYWTYLYHNHDPHSFVPHAYSDSNVGTNSDHLEFPKMGWTTNFELKVDDLFHIEHSYLTIRLFSDRWTTMSMIARENRIPGASHA
jgi:hypothetical protein